MPTQVYHAGFEGIVTIAGIDMNITEWDATETTQESETTNTSNYDAASGRCFRTVIGTTTSLEGNFTAGYDSSNRPAASSRDGLNAAIVLTLSRSPLQTISCPAFIKTNAYKNGGMQGHGEVTFSFTSNGTVSFL